MKPPLVPALVVLDDPRSFTAEAYRVLRTNLDYANPDSAIRRVVVTSAGAGEGKSTTAANLAASLARAGRTVLLVDADLRRPVLHEVFGVPSSPGLSTYLAGQAQLDTVVLKTAVAGLSLVASGRIPPNPSELLASRRMHEFLDAMAGQYERVLIDTPPVLAVSDPCVLAPHVDGVLLIVESGGAPRAALRRAKERIEAVRGRIIGAVMNRFDPGADGYSRRYYDGYYRSYYDRDRRGGKTP